jgi:hypothetical protein
MRCAASFLFTIAAALMVSAADSDTRGIVAEEFVKARPGAASTAAPQYKSLNANAMKDLRQGGSGAQIGVTIWRLRRSVATDGGARILVQEENNTVEWTPERVTSTGRLKAGDRVRLSIESAARGYLYVIDRERYGANEYGDPYLIFPTLRTRNGDNSVVPGKLIDIPGQEDRPNFFSLHQTRAGQTGEELTVLVTPLPLDGVTIGRSAQVIAIETFADWNKRFGAARTDLFELAGSSDKTWTTAEQQAAAAGGTRLLTQEDPAPQTLYRAAVKRGEPLLVKVELRFGSGPSR